MHEIDTIRGRRWKLGLSLILAAAFGLAACAPKQFVPLDVGPGEVQVFVDGESVDPPVPERLDLYSNRGHVIFVKRPGYRAQQVVLHSVEQPEGPPRLEPERVMVRLRPETPKGRHIEVELDEAPGEPLPTEEVPASR